MTPTLIVKRCDFRNQRQFRVYLSVAIGLCAVLILSALGFFVLMPDEQVSAANVKKLRIGMTKQEVKSVLGSSLQDQTLQGNMMHWMVGSSPPQYMWAKPGGCVYVASVPPELSLTGPQECWGSSTCYIMIQFDEQEQVEGIMSFPAICDESWSGTPWERLKKRIQYWRERWNI